MSRKPPQAALTKWQRRVLADLRAQAKAQPDLLTVGAQTRAEGGNLLVLFALATTDLPPATTDGLSFHPTEQFTLFVAPTDERPPTVLLRHHRFMGIPHVLSGFQLCLYLDESREWDPKKPVAGKRGILQRLWEWMTKATQNDFNPDAALFHAVGGVPHITPGAPTIVIRDLCAPVRRAAAAHLRQRTPNRLDLASGTATPLPESDHATTNVPVFFVDSDMPLGAGDLFLGTLLALVHNPRLPAMFFARPNNPTPALTRRSSASHAVSAATAHGCPRFPYSPEPNTPPSTYPTTPDAALMTALAASASRNPPGSEQHLILAVPHPSGGPHHLVALRLPPEVADYLRGHVEHKTGPLIAYEPHDIHVAAPIEWCYVSDERADVTTRRDTDRPVTSLLDKKVAVLGCGGLGSWIAEFVLRAGARHLVVSDNGRVTGGLLVRQNYAEDDIGTHKAIALKTRLDSISDHAIVEAVGPLSTGVLAKLAQDVDLIIDATISLKMTRQLDTFAADPNRMVTIAQVATDAKTGTLGLVTINPPGHSATMENMDHHVRDVVRSDGALERYRYFWEEPSTGDEFIPTRGCSAPTFHGSAADLAALTGSLTTLIAQHLAIPAPGSHLIALPHSGIAPAHKYVHHTPTSDSAA